MSVRLDQFPSDASTLSRRVAAVEKALRERAAQLSDVVRRADASVAMLIGSAWSLLDRAGNVIVSEDSSGAGLGLPYIPMTFTTARYTDWPASTSATFEDIHRATVKRLQTYAYVIIGHTTDVSGTTGEIQVTANGSVIGSTISVTFTQAATTVGPFAMPGAYKGQVDLKVRARRTGGTGNVRCAVLAASGIES